MANPAEIEAQVRFALDRLPARNAHHEFEQMCRHLTKQFICSNVLPATGPVSAGGDQGRDFETFRTYLQAELGPYGAFLGLVGDGPVAFICTLQADNVTTKIRKDIATVCASGQPVTEIRAFTLASVPVGVRHRLQDEVQEAHNVRLEFHDAESIAERLASPEGFWIAEHFLSLPAEVRPDAPPDDGNLTDDYIELRRKWREDPVLYPTLGTFLEIRTGLHESMYRESARSDLAFWLGHIRELLTDPELPDHIRQRARYELVVITLRGTGRMRPVDQITRAYLDESLQESEPARLENACILLMYVHGAARNGVTTIRPAELDHWVVKLARHIEELIPGETPHGRASLLSTLGFLGLFPAQSEDQLTDEPLYNDIDPTPPPWALTDIPFPSDYAYRDVSRSLSAWTELAEGLEDTPLFPLQHLAQGIQMLLPLWSTQPEWRRLLDLIDDEIGAREGKQAVAARASDRAMALMNGGHTLEALEELHRVRIDWWSGETIRGSVLASLIIAQLYAQLGLFAAAKTYALAAATVAATNDDERLAYLAPRGLLIAADCEFLSGAWYGAAELYGLGLLTQYHIGSGGIDLEEDEMIRNAVLHLTYIVACAGEVDPGLGSAMQAIVNRSGFQELVVQAIAHNFKGSRQPWGSFGEEELSSPLFSDLGPTRCIRFTALGTDWTLLTDNDEDSVGVAERFAAGVQTMLVALAREDLCLIPTDITVRIERRREAVSPSPADIEALPSNEGREWKVRLTPTASFDVEHLEQINQELLSVLAMILREASVLPGDDFFNTMERAFQRGLGHKLAPAVQLEQFAETFSINADDGVDRRSITVPWECPSRTLTSHEELRWRDGPGPTYTKDKALELLQTRYEALARVLRITTAALACSQEFQLVVRSLRGQGWLDWHILTAVANISLNYRSQLDRSTPPSEETMRELLQAAFRPESATAPPVPVALFTIEHMEKGRQAAMLSLLKKWGLECHQRTPDMAAIGRLLAARYGYWDEDIPHEDPFPDNTATTSAGIWTPPASP